MDMSTYASRSEFSLSRLSGLIIGMALGALAMYAFDPRQGRRRRHEARDKLHSASLKTRRKVDAKSRHLANRAKGLQAKASHLLH